MKTALAAALAATLLAGTAASAQAIRPLESTASTQAQTLVVLGTPLPVGFVVVGTVLIAGITYAIIAQGDGTAATATQG